MIKDQKITLNGRTIPNVREVTVKLETPGDRRGIYREPTFAATVHIVRDASDNPIVDLFEMTTNEDGRKNILTSGTLEFHGDDVKDQYKFELKRSFISNWTLNNPSSPNAPTLESVEIRVGHIEFNGPDGGGNFELKTFK
jgi:hypothetical protein